MASFFLSTAMRVGPGNIIGVTGAIAVGGPGALFWMWVSAFFGMATAYMEGTLAQIFKEKKGDEFVGGLPFYGRKLLGVLLGIGVIAVTGVLDDTRTLKAWQQLIGQVIAAVIVVTFGIKIEHLDIPF